MEKRNNQLEHRQPMEQVLVLHVRLGCGSLSLTTPVSLLAIEFDVQVSLASVNQICVVHEAMNG